MNIKQAKEQIKYAVAAYLTEDEYGEPVIPIERQRPIFLMGALLHFHLGAMYLNAGKRRAFVFFALAALLVLAAFASIFY